MDNGEDWQKPNTFGEAALRSLEGVLDQLRSRDWRGLLLTGKPFVFAVGADIGEFGEITPERARLGGAGGPRALRPDPRAAVHHGRGDQRRCARRRSRDRAPLRLPHDRVLGPPLRLPRGLPRAYPRLGRNAADPAARRRRAGGDVHRREPAPPEPDAGRAAGIRRRLRGRAASSRSSSSTSRSRSCSTRSRRVAASGGLRPISRTSREVCRKARSRLDGQVHGATPAPYRALDLDRRRRDLVARGGLPRRGGRARGAPSRPAGPGLRLRVRPRRAPREARRRACRRPSRGASQRVGIVGAGLMARQLALLFLRRLEVPVVLRDLTQEQVDEALAWIRDELAELVRRGRLGEGKARFLGSLVTGGTGWESSPAATSSRGGVRGDGGEEGGVRRARAGRLARVRPRDEHVVALGHGDGPSLEHPERVVGMHFFNPVAVLPLVELVRTPRPTTPRSRPRGR